MSQVDVAQVAEAMHALVAECHGRRNLKATDLTKAMLERFGEASCDKAIVQAGHPGADRRRPMHLLVPRRELHRAAA